MSIIGQSKKKVKQNEYYVLQNNAIAELKVRWKYVYWWKEMLLKHVVV